VRAAPGAVQQLQPGMLVQVGDDLASVVDAVVIAPITTITGDRGNAASTWGWRRDEVRRAAAAHSLHPAPGTHLNRAEHSDLPVLPRWGIGDDHLERPQGSLRARLQPAVCDRRPVLLKGTLHLPSEIHVMAG